MRLLPRNDDPTGDSVLYDSERTIIGYGPDSSNEDDLRFAQAEERATDSQVDASINRYLAIARNLGAEPRRRIQTDTLLAQSRRIWDIATSGMSGGQSSSVTSNTGPVPEEEHCNKDGTDHLDEDSETQIPIQVQVSSVLFAYLSLIAFF